MSTPKLTTAELRQFSGSDVLYQHPLMRPFRYTSGVQFMARRGGAYWLVDAVFSHQHDPKVRSEPFQLWRLVVDGSRATLTCTDDNDTPPLVVQDIDYTDFPLSMVELYLEDGVLMLPSER